MNNYQQILIGFFGFFALTTIYSVLQRVESCFIKGSIFGFFLCIGSEISLVIFYLYWRIIKGHSMSKLKINLSMVHFCFFLMISSVKFLLQNSFLFHFYSHQKLIFVFLVKLEIDKLFGQETAEGIREKNKIKKLFINKFSHEQKLLSSVFNKDETHIPNQSSSKKNGLSKIEDQDTQHSISGIQNPQSISQQRNNILNETKIKKLGTNTSNDTQKQKESMKEKKKHILDEIQQLEFIKVDKKKYLNKVTQFGKFFEVFISLEKNFAKEIRTIGKPRFLRTCHFDLVVQRDERYTHMYKMNEIDTAYQEDFNNLFSLNEIKSNTSDTKLIILPNWLIIKNLFLDMSNIHDQLVQYIQFGIFDLTKVLTEEYDDSYRKLKTMKKETQALIKKKLEDAKISEKAYHGISKKIKDLAELYNDQSSNLNREVARKRVELKGEIELMLYDKNNSKIKMNAAYETLHKAKLEANKINIRIQSHKKCWEKRFQSIFKTSTKSIISGFFDMTKDLQKKLKHILHSNLKQTSVSNKNMNFDSQSFDKEGSFYSSTGGSSYHRKHRIFDQSTQKYNNQNFQNESFISNPSKLQINKNILFNSNINPSLICLNHRQQLSEYIKISERFNNESIEIEKYEQEVTILIEDICTTFNKYQQEFENKIGKTNVFRQMGDSLIYEQLGSFIQIDICDYTKRFIKNLIVHFEKSLTPFHAISQQVQKDLQQEKKLFRQNIVAFEELQINLDRICEHQQQNREPEFNFQQRYDTLKIRFDDTHEKLNYIKSQIENIIKRHEKGVEDLKKQIINSLVSFTTQLADRLDLIENNSDTILSQDDEFFDNKSDSQSVHSRNSVQSHQPVLMNKKSSTGTIGHADFLHKYQSNDEVFENQNQNIQAVQADQYGLAATIITKLLKVFYDQWKDSENFKEKIKNELYFSFNKNLDSFLEEMIITKLLIKGEGPEIKSITPQKSEDYEFLVDLELSYKGTIYFEIDTAYHLNWPKANSYKLPLVLKIKLNEFYSIIRLCYVPRVYGKSWFSFIGEPAISIDIDPIISNKYHVSRLPKVKTLIQELISQKIKKMTYPNRDSIKIPLSKADKLISKIREKLLHKRQTPHLDDDSDSHIKFQSHLIKDLNK